MSDTKTNGVNAEITALSNRLRELEASTTSRINVLEAIVQAQQVQIDQLIAGRKVLRPRTNPAPNPEVEKRDTKMPRFRQNCRQYGTCKNKMCGFTHAKQQELFGGAIEELPNC